MYGGDLGLSLDSGETEGRSAVMYSVVWISLVREWKSTCLLFLVLP